MLELIVLLKKPEKEKNYKVYKIEPNNLNDGHIKGCIEFIKEHNLEIDISDEVTSYSISLEMAKLGYPNLHVENKNLLIFLSPILTKEQIKWFKDNYYFLSKFILNVVSIQKDGSLLDLSDLNENDESCCKLNDLKREIKKKAFFSEEKAPLKRR